MRMDTVWERLGGRELSLPLLFPSYFSDFSSLHMMLCSKEVADELGIPMLL